MREQYGNCLGCSVMLFFLFIGCVPPYSPTGDEHPVAPQISSVVPADGAVNVAPDAVVTVTFTAPVDPASVTIYSLRLQDATGKEVPATVAVSEDALSAAVTPTAMFKEGHAYTVEVTRQIRDRDGIPLDLGGAETIFISTFSVVATPPTVVAVTPADGETVSPDLAAVEIAFSEPMDAVTITPATFLVSEVDGIVSYDPETLTARFEISGSLAPLHTYTIFVAGTVTDEAGIPLGNDLIVRFSTTE